jgi:hypothetical protein
MDRPLLCIAKAMRPTLGDPDRLRQLLIRPLVMLDLMSITMRSK